MEKPIFKLENLERYYHTKSEVVKAIDDLSFEINAGEFVVLIGPSGSGKTTLLNLLSGLDKATNGKLFFKGKDMASLTDSQLSELRRHEIGIIFQFYNLHPSFTALENIEYPMMIVNVPKETRKRKALELIQLVGLEEKKDKFPGELSGGEKQRIGIARSLANDPSVIIADEPTGDLDSDTAVYIIELINNACYIQGKTIVLVTHDESIIRKDMRVVQLVDGKVD